MALEIARGTYTFVVNTSQGRQEVTVSIDVKMQELARHLADRAHRSKSGVATLADGRVKVTQINFKPAAVAETAQ